MKTMKLNLLEKKEMNEVRGGKQVPGGDVACGCGCLTSGGLDNSTQSWQVDHDKQNPSANVSIFRGPFAR